VKSSAILKPVSNALSTGIRVFLKTEMCVRTSARFQAPKTQVFENGLQGRVFENVGLPFSYSNTLRADGYFFSKTEKKILRFQKYTDTYGQGLKWQRKHKKGLLHLSFHQKVFFVKFDFHEA